MTSAVRSARPLPHGAPTPASTRPRPDLHLVGTRPRRARPGLVVAAVTVVVFGALVAGAISHSLLVSSQVQLDGTNDQVRAEQELLRSEQLELARLASPARLAEEAAARGLVEPAEQTWINPATGDEPVVTEGPGTATTVPTGQSDEPDQTDPAAAGGSELAGAALDRP